MCYTKDIEPPQNANILVKTDVKQGRWCEKLKV